MSKFPILYVEDDDNDVFLLKRAFAAGGIENPLQVVYDGQQAIDYLSGGSEFDNRERFPLPGLIILDLKLPRGSGFEVVEWLRRNADLSCLPVIVFTSSEYGGEAEHAYRLGANSFVVKPADTQERTEFAHAIKDYWLRFHVVPGIVIKNTLGSRATERV